MIRLLVAWFGLSLVAAPVVGRFLAGAETSRHACGGTLLFVREADGHSYERCACGWSYDFDKGRASDAAAPVRLTPASGETTARVSA